MTTITKPQRKSLKRLYDRMQTWDDPPTITYRQFRRLVQPYPCDNCILVPFGTMYIGIEIDGYTHS